MIRQLAEMTNTGGAELIALLLFIAVFSAVVLRVLAMSREESDNFSRLPFEAHESASCSSEPASLSRRD